MTGDVMAELQSQQVALDLAKQALKRALLKRVYRAGISTWAAIAPRELEDAALFDLLAQAIVDQHEYALEQQRIAARCELAANDMKKALKNATFDKKLFERLQAAENVCEAAEKMWKPTSSPGDVAETLTKWRALVKSMNEIEGE